MMRINEGASVSRNKLAIVSTYDDMCGIAGYTRALERQLSPYADVQVEDLDQYLLRSPHKRVQRLGDKHIKDICSKLRSFDCVNVQLEHGTLGRDASYILKRLTWLAKASPRLTITFHTILQSEPLPFDKMWKFVKQGKLGAAKNAWGAYIKNNTLTAGVYHMIRKLQFTKHVEVIVHTKRDMRLLRDVYRIKNVHHHPLSFVSKDEALRIRETASRAMFPSMRDLPTDAKLVGTFGFLSPYKGFETALRALRFLPDDHHLLIFGGIHPQTIKKNVPLDVYVETLLDEANVTGGVLQTIGGRPQREPDGTIRAPKASQVAPGAPAISVSLEVDASTRDLLTRHPDDMSKRVHFMGVLNDEGFMNAMSLCDVVVLPYMEVGQSSSGPISIATDMGCRVIASRNAAFLQFGRYQPQGAVEFFDIGNYLELSERIKAVPSKVSITGERKFTSSTNTRLYLESSGFKEAVKQLIKTEGLAP
jgi:glycosyltransferase involved in cell wall biosynthesis